MIYDAIVVGSGIAGSVCAYYLSRAGLSTAILSKSGDLAECNTYFAQGGIVYRGKNDTPDMLYDDIMAAGAGICNPDAVRTLADNAAPLVDEILINEFKVQFSGDGKGGMDLTDEAAHSARRILHASDTTGRSIEESALESLKKQKGLAVLADYTAIDIITIDHHSSDKFRMYKPMTSLGVYALNNRTNNVEKILGRTVILASGGMGRLFLHTTNPPSATGDGYAMAFRAGARLVNMEYTQFHPTTLYHPKAENFLISESVRGEGAVILDAGGRRFMEKYHPLKELAPRDVVTRGILSEMLETGAKYVYLDVTPIGKDKIRARFPNIYARCLEYGFDITEEAIPIVPAFHFSCGGILTDMFGRTSIDRLFAVGEVACTGLHGANRLASTSLLEGVVFGKRIADYLGAYFGQYRDFAFPEVSDWIDTGIYDTDPALINQDWNSLQNIMWNYVGAIRGSKRLRRAIIDLSNLRDDIEDFYRDARVHRSIIELRNAAQTGFIVARQALANRQSIGCHYRTD